MCGLSIIGTLVGPQIPLLMRILQDETISVNLAPVLAFDYIGALVASLLFPPSPGARP